MARVHSPEALNAGRAALARGAWEQARVAYAEALAGEETAEALEGLSWAAWWLDDVEACFDLRERAYRRYREAGDLRGAARLALWLGDDYLEFRGEQAVANGWTRRAARLLEDLEPAPEHGWLAVFEAHAALGAHDAALARRLAGEARELGRRLGGGRPRDVRASPPRARRWSRTARSPRACAGSTRPPPRRSGASTRTCGRRAGPAAT